MTQKRILAFTILSLVPFFIGCSKMPPDETIKASIRESLLQQLPMSWSGSPVGYRNPRIEAVEIIEKGKFDSKEKTLIVKARVMGAVEAFVPPGNWQPNKFDDVAEFRLYQDDTGRWHSAPETVR